MKRGVQHLLMNLWVNRHEGEARDELLHGQPPMSEGERTTVLAEAEREGYVTNRGAAWDLTERGQALARAILRRHRLAERLLSDILELPEEEFERSACRFEHHISESVAERICTLLGHPTTCPHGRPIPPGDCCAARRRLVEPIVERLSDLATDDEARVVFLTPTIGDRLDKLTVLGLVPGSLIRLRQKLPAFIVQVGETEVALDESVAREVYVSRLTGSAGAPGEPRDTLWSRVKALASGQPPRR